jgi:hypothetical protein
MVNIRQKEYEKMCIELLLTIRDYAMTEAQKKGLNPYDVKICIEDLRKRFCTYNSASNFAFQRYLENLFARGLLSNDYSKGAFEAISLRRRKEAQEYFKHTDTTITLPEDKPLPKP